MQTRAEVLTDAGQLEAVRSAWDGLAQAAQAPFGASAWSLAWWRHAAPRAAVLRAVVVRDDAGIAGVAPFYAHAGAGMVRYGVLGDTVCSPVTPLARAGAQAAVAAAVAAELARVRPRPDLIAFDNLPATSPWPDLLRARWPGRGRPLLLRSERLATPLLELDGTYEQWLAGQSRNFRQQLRRHRRRLEARGAVFRMLTDAGELEERVDDFARLHHARFAGRGGSAVLDPGVLRMLVDAGARMLDGGDYRLWLVEVDGKVISAHLLLAAGGRVTYWLGGFDDDWGSEQPALQTLAAALEHAYASGATAFDLGPGAQDYKERFTKQAVPGVDALLVPPGVRRAAAHARGLPPPLPPPARRPARAG
ncbi:MAG TPA: GNAT family N-acetyltransferase, partial [Euzebyales bacterium]|nr:GNAT family N-acetyltransferase [Euzebyales bacterium]